MSHISVKKEPTELHLLLLRGFPGTKQKPASVTATVAPALGVSPYAVYKWLTKGKIPAGRAKDIVELSKGRISMSKLMPFIVS